MAEQHQFDCHEDYVKAQTKLTSFKINRKKTTRCFCVDAVVAVIEEHFDPRLTDPRGLFGLCHGVRTGQELDMFENAFGGGWVGTEIFPEICDGKRILNQSFDELPASWCGAFDIVYSNSFDHSRYPRGTASTWVEALAPGGRLFVEWTEWHEKLGSRGNRADCYAASLDEYIEVFNRAGEVETVLDAFEQCERKIVVVKCKQN
jgi:SAM-dependent methyltransferase